MADGRTGIWLVGARGGVATTVAVGLAALRGGDAAPLGLVTETPPFSGIDLPSWDRLVVGGHEVRGGTLFESARQLEAGHGLPAGASERYRAELEAIDVRVRPGVALRSGPAIEALADDAWTCRVTSPRDAVERIAADVQAFRSANGLARVVVVLVSSTEPPVDLRRVPEDEAALDVSLDDRAGSALPASSLYALGAAAAGAALVNFTPSLGAGCPGIGRKFLRLGLPHAGSDGKTGETLLKSALAPMFAARGLRVDSWVGHNLLGNRDGAVLADPEHRRAKVENKERLLESLLGEAPQSHVSIESIASLGDWKTSWNHVHFRGFLGVPMVLQLTWQGCDSALAAPLVLDLARLADLALRRGESGALTALAPFFKNPTGTAPRPFGDEMSALVAWARG